MLDKYEFRLKVVQPLYMGGADPRRTEWRAPSVKGLMRWWFRAVGGRREEEGKLFGIASREVTCSSPFILRCETQSVPEAGKLPSKYFGYGLEGRQAFWPSSKLEIKIAFYPSVGDDIKKKVFASLWLAVNLGGFGGRSRRVYGSLAFEKQNEGKINRLFGNAIAFSPLKEPQEEIPKALGKIAEIFGISEPLPIKIYLFKDKLWGEGDSLECKYKEYRRQCLRNPERRQAFGLPLKGYREERFASQIIFKAIEERVCLITIIKSFELSSEMEKKMPKRKIIQIMEGFCQEIKAQKIYPKEGDKNV